MSDSGMNRRDFMRIIGMSSVSVAAGCVSPGGEKKSVVKLGAEYPPLEQIYGYVPEKNVDKDEFSFCVWADPQISSVQQDVRVKGGNWRDLPVELQTTEGRLRKTVELTNAINPDFVLVAGDVVHFSGQKEWFERHIEITKGLKPPQYLLVGNHDFCEPEWKAGHYKSTEGKEYFGNFRWAQRTVNGLDKVNYSFDAGKWHVIMFSVPGVGGQLQSRFLKEHPEHIEWLVNDLKAHKDKPTIFLTHPPLLPVGRYGMEIYGPNSRQRRELVEILTKQGNVKLCLFGHIHNTVSSIDDVAWDYKDASWMTLPTTSFDGVRDGDYTEDAKTSYGFATFHVKGEELGSMHFTTILGEKYEFPLEEFRKYDHSYMDSLWEDQELPANKGIVNGDFHKPLKKGWFLSDIVAKKEPPLEAVREIREVDGRDALWMFGGGQMARGTLTRYGHRVSVKQAVRPPKSGDSPVLSFDYKIPSDSFAETGKQCAYVHITGHMSDEWTTNNDWHPNISIEKFVPQWRLKYNIGVPVKDSYKEQPGLFHSPPVLDKWQSCKINVLEDLKNAYPDRDITKVDGIVITMGVWNLGVGKTPEDRERIGVYLGKVEWDAGAKKEGMTSPVFRMLTAKEADDMQRGKR